MSFASRKNKILNYLKKNQTATTNQLTNYIPSTISTTRRDLIKLEKEGLIYRYHGGVSLSEKALGQYNFPIDKIENTEKKSIIGKGAKDLITDNMTIFLDSSTTVQYLCQEIKKCKNINIITNGLNIAKYFQNSENIKCFICPGLLKPNTMTIIGHFAEEFLKNFHADLMFFSCHSINPTGIFEIDETILNIKKAMFRHSKKHILLCDSTKESQQGYLKLLDFKEIDTIISDEPFSQATENAIRQKDCQKITLVNK